ncbi:Uncharacterised protein [Mycobacteroides abscessus subsp. bolletii]|nr:Uncharacterised protein [Mycobacteroides abscessus subsp. bolletii]SKG42335.1 Uncharacterised protein [Mycobacteroides abscessus subsp. bolletii]SKH18295.1 Uncharacterised protein [Mycobacteroides abscessus subsp. bolletii]SKH65957.1 Uncharacterised protein [Mycobacteroides abscessus subsp. bolletii]SKH66017.1 Uncharacterised protein [Mycobacteroides abscessus subsp. bolletii]
MRVRAHLGRRQPQQSRDRALHDIQDRLALMSGRVQCLQLKRLGGGDIGVQLLQAGAVLLMELRSSKLRDAGQ